MCIYGSFLKWWYQTTIEFLIQMIILGVFWGYHHLRKHPYICAYILLYFTYVLVFIGPVLLLLLSSCFVIMAIIIKVIINSLLLLTIVFFVRIVIVVINSTVAIIITISSSIIMILIIAIYRIMYNKDTRIHCNTFVSTQ